MCSEILKAIIISLMELLDQPRLTLSDCASVCFTLGAKMISITIYLLAKVVGSLNTKTTCQPLQLKLSY